MNTYTRILRSTLLASLTFGLVACSGGSDVMTRANELAAAKPNPTIVVSHDTPEHSAPDAREQATTDLTIESLDDLRAAARRVQDARPRFYDTIMAMEPGHTRNHLRRYTQPEMHDPDAAPIFAIRLLEEQDAPNLERMAMVDAIARTVGNFGPYLVVLMPEEADPEIRASLVDQLRRAEPESARRGLELTLADLDAGVRAAAFRTLASQETLRDTLLSEHIVAALDDQDDAVRTAAAFAARVRSEEIALGRLLVLAQDNSGDVRIQALRAIESIDSSRLALLDLQALSKDDDHRVSSFASQALARLAN